MNYSGRWTAGLKPEDQKKFEFLLQNDNKVLDRLLEICYNMVKESEDSTSDYTNPNWAYKTADSIGYRRALQKVIDLCTPKKDRNDL